jgi:hypothetical protein
LITLSFQGLTVEKAIMKIAGNVGMTYIKKDGATGDRMTEALIAESFSDKSTPADRVKDKLISANHSQNGADFPFKKIAAPIDRLPQGAPPAVAGELSVRTLGGCVCTRARYSRHLPGE